jgi:hypothetical protein
MGDPAFDRVLLLATLTLYWTTATITTSLLPHWAYRHLAGGAPPDGDVPPVRTEISIFGGERVPFLIPEKRLISNALRLVQRSFPWTTTAQIPAIRNNKPAGFTRERSLVGAQPVPIIRILRGIGDINAASKAVDYLTIWIVRSIPS